MSAKGSRTRYPGFENLQTQSSLRAMLFCLAVTIGFLPDSESSSSCTISQGDKSGLLLTTILEPGQIQRPMEHCPQLSTASQVPLACFHKIALCCAQQITVTGASLTGSGLHDKFPRIIKFLALVSHFALSRAGGSSCMNTSSSLLRFPFYSISLIKSSHQVFKCKKEQNLKGSHQVSNAGNNKIWAHSPADSS